MWPTYFFICLINSEPNFALNRLYNWITEIQQRLDFFSNHAHAQKGGGVQSNLHSSNVCEFAKQLASTKGGVVAERREAERRCSQEEYRSACACTGGVFHP
jgi:hypothetical protein